MKALSSNQKQNLILINVLWVCLVAVTFFSMRSQQDLLVTDIGIIICLYLIIIFLNIFVTYSTIMTYTIMFAFISYLFYLSYTMPTIVNFIFFVVCIVFASFYLNKQMLIFAAVSSIFCQTILFHLKGNALLNQSNVNNYLTIVVFSLIVFILLFLKGHLLEAAQKKENQLHSTKTLYDSIFAFSKDAIVLLDKNGIILEQNQAFINLFELPEKDVIGENIQKFFPDSKQEIEHALRSIKKETCNNWYEFSAIKGNDDIMLADVTFSPITSAYKNNDCTISCIIRDITEKKLVDEYLRNSEKLKITGEIAAGVAHEIRNPLTVISGFIQIMNDENGKNKQYLDIIASEIERMKGIISEFLVLSKPHVSNIKLHNIKDLMEDVILLLQSEAINREVEINPNYTESPLYVYCEGTQLKQVFINIIKNSIEAMPNGGHVKISCKESGADTIKITISDNGIGIPEEIIPRVGKPFFTTKEHGTGLGFMISERIIEQHHGSISVNSETSQGTSVHINLPFVKSNTPDSYLDSKKVE